MLTDGSEPRLYAGQKTKTNNNNNNNNNAPFLSMNIFSFPD
jgi:hypothetical protein